jgi:cation transport regulator
MPYKNSSALPAAERQRLPAQAQRIYPSAFNNAWAQYSDRENRRKGVSREETAHKVAWSAVERVYEKGKNGTWRKRT